MIDLSKSRKRNF